MFIVKIKQHFATDLHVERKSLEACEKKMGAKPADSTDRLTRKPILSFIKNDKKLFEKKAESSVRGGE